MAVKDIDVLEKSFVEMLGEMIDQVPLELRLHGLKAEERLAGLKAEERLAGLSPEELERLKRLLQ
jgi:hypothetical protein